MLSYSDFVFSFKFKVSRFNYLKYGICVADSKAKHCFMSEVVQFKQKFLLEAFKGNDFDDCCLFSDATKVFTDERECLRHKGRTAPCSCEPYH